MPHARGRELSEQGWSTQAEIRDRIQSCYCDYMLSTAFSSREPYHSGKNYDSPNLGENIVLENFQGHSMSVKGMRLIANSSKVKCKTYLGREKCAVL